MERWQLAGYRGRPGGVNPFVYGGRDPLSAVRRGGILPDRNSGIGAGLGGVGGFRDPFARRGTPAGGRFHLGQGIPSPNLPYVPGPGLRREPDPLLPHALGPVRRLSTGVDPLYYSGYPRECDCAECRHHRRDSGLGLSDRYAPPCDRHRLSDTRDNRHSLSSLSRLLYDHSHSSSNSLSCHKNKPEHFDFKTRDIAVRGKTYTVRASYLAEASKFEADLEKYVSKKHEKVLPDQVVDMLISFINTENYHSSSLLDEVTLNILASAVSAKSAFEFGLSRLKKIDCDVGERELSEICATVLCSDKVDSKLKDWLKEYFNYKKDPRRADWLVESYEWRELNEDKPECHPRLLELLGVRKTPEEKDHRVL